MLLISFSVSSCDKDQNNVPPANHVVKYEVLTSSGDWFGEWVDENNKKVVMTQAPLNKSGWTFTFSPKTYPIELNCHATADCGTCNSTRTASPDVTVNVYVDDKLVKTEINNWAKGVTTALFKLEK